jgi:hypothetical protein
MHAKNSVVVASHTPRGFHDDADSAPAAESSNRNGFVAIAESARGF